jgi:uncharacterized protein (TIGR00730 family)
MSTIVNVGVFCGASVPKGPQHVADANTLGRAIGSHRRRLVYGGGRAGLMGQVADSAREAGAEVTGVIPDFLIKMEAAHVELTELIAVKDLFERKRIMLDRSDGFVIIGGGFGTLDELFEVLTWKQLGQLPKPIVVLDRDGQWAPLRIMIDHLIATGFARPRHADLLTIVTDVADVLPALDTPMIQIEDPRPKATAGLPKIA